MRRIERDLKRAFPGAKIETTNGNHLRLRLTERGVGIRGIDARLQPQHDEHQGRRPAADDETAIPMKYYDLKRNWRKVKPHIAHPEVQAILVRDFNKFTFGRWRQRFEPGMLPTQFESCDWQYDWPGRHPAFWAYTKHSACHWLVNFTLLLAQRVEPDRQWRIITSQLHSTVWDGEHLLFDFNFNAMGIAPEECFALARKRELKPGKLLTVHFVEHYSLDKERVAERGNNERIETLIAKPKLTGAEREQLRRMLG